ARSGPSRRGGAARQPAPGDRLQPAADRGRAAAVAAPAAAAPERARARPRRRAAASHPPPTGAPVRLLRQQRPQLQAALAVAPGIDRGLFDASLGALPVARITGQTKALMSAATAGGRA